MSIDQYTDSCQPWHGVITGPAGDIEVRLEAPAQARRPTTLALVCHPHPLYGGNMDNKVVYILAQTLRQLGAVSARFNFRGVGRSAGRFDHGEGETADLLWLAAELKRRCGAEQLWLAGFSFGSYVALRAHRPLLPQRLVLVAPPVQRFDFSRDALAEGVPSLVIQGGQDEVVAPAGVEAWLRGQEHPPHYHYLPHTGHFFHGHLPQLRDALRSWHQALDAATESAS